MLPLENGIRAFSAKHRNWAGNRNKKTQIALVDIGISLYKSLPKLEKNAPPLLSILFAKC